MVGWCMGGHTWVSSCCFGGLSCSSSFYFAASRVQSVARGVVDCAPELTLLTSCVLFSRREKTLRSWSACKVNFVT